MIRNITNISIIDKIICRFIQIFLLIKYEFICIFTKPPIIENSENTIDAIINNKASISRFGDGEFELIKNHDIKFQKSSKLIAERLIEVLQSDNSNLLIGIPKVFTKDDLRIKTRSERIFWMESVSMYKAIIYKYINLNKVYYDSIFTRPYMGYKNKKGCRQYFDKVKSIWNGKDVIIVEGVYSRLGVGNDLFEKCSSIKRILAPYENAFEKYDEILKEVYKESRDSIVLIALGPTATIMAYDLSQKGYQAIDIGHIDIEYEWFLKNAENKVKIENKYTNEAVGGDCIDNLYNIHDKKYRSQIIQIIN